MDPWFETSCKSKERVLSLVLIIWVFQLIKYRCVGIVERVGNRPEASECDEMGMTLQNHTILTSS